MSLTSSAVFHRDQRTECSAPSSDDLAARADVAAALADVRQIRASLGLPQQPDEGDLGQVPADIDQSFSSVLQAQAGLIQSAAQLGVIHPFEETLKQMLAGMRQIAVVRRNAAVAPEPAGSTAFLCPISRWTS